MKCECGFTVEVCATNLCMRKKVHSAGLTPGSKWPEPAPIRNRIKDTATSHEAKPFMMLSCREAGRCLHNLPGCICEVDPCYDVDLRLSAGNANVREALELAEDVLSRAPFSTGIWPNGMHPQTGIDKIRDAIRSLGEPQTSWQPVETAPHGRDVLLGYVNWHSQEWVCEVGQASHGWTRNGVSTMSRHGQATHWQPLPGAPELSRPHDGGAS